MSERTHYLPAFVRRDSIGRQQAACGTYVWGSEHRSDPEEIGCLDCLRKVLHPEELETTERSVA